MASDQTRNLLKSKALDLVLVLGVLLGVKAVFLEFENTWQFAGPISLLAAVVVATWSLRINRESWGQLGLKKPESFLKTAVLSIVVLLLITIFNVAGGALGDLFFGPQVPGPDRFGNLEGNTLLFTQWVILAWVFGGFAEEMIYRAYLISRFERLFLKLPFAIPMAVVVPALIFGFRHYYYQGPVGAVATGATALALGFYYVKFGRINLWPLVIGHGLIDTLTFFVDYIPCAEEEPYGWLC